MSQTALDAERLVDALDLALSSLRCIADGEWNEPGFRQAEGRDYDISVEVFARQTLAHLGRPFDELEVLGDLRDMVL